MSRGNGIADRVRLPQRFEPERLRADLEQLATAEWIPHFVQQNYTGEWSVLPLRAPAGATHPVMMIYSDPACSEFTDTPLLGECPYFQAVLASFRCPLEAVRLMRLTPGSVILEHTDLDLSVEAGRARLHIPITTNVGVDFRLNGSPVSMTAGECWYLRLSDPHSVANRGETNRVHMVIDAIVDDGLWKTLAAGSE